MDEGKQKEKSRSSNLRVAKKAKNDEFYTQLSDIEKEVKNYKKYFPALIQNLATLVWFLCNIHAATKSRKNYKKIQKKPGGKFFNL